MSGKKLTSETTRAARTIQVNKKPRKPRAVLEAEIKSEPHNMPAPMVPIEDDPTVVKPEAEADPFLPAFSAKQALDMVNATPGWDDFTRAQQLAVIRYIIDHIQEAAKKKEREVRILFSDSRLVTALGFEPPRFELVPRFMHKWTVENGYRCSPTGTGVSAVFSW